MNEMERIATAGVSTGFAMTEYREYVALIERVFGALAEVNEQKGEK